MSSFYGNVKSSPRSPFIFDRIYSSRTEMDNALKVQKDNNDAVQGDGVFINRYVLVNYGYTINEEYVRVDNNLITSDQSSYANLYVKVLNEDTYEYILGSTLSSNDFNTYKDSEWYKKDHYITRYNENGVENIYFKENRTLDQKNYNADYHLTVWMKIYMDNEEKYIMVAKLNSQAPAIEIRETSPAEGNPTGQLGPHWDLFQSSDINWVCDIPKHWEISLNTQDIDEVETIFIEESSNDDELPYFNKAGFDDKISNNTDSLEDNDPRKIDRIWLAPFKSGAYYPVFEFKKIELTPDTYIKNKYYYISNSFISNDDYDPNQTYYTYNEDENEYIATKIDSNTYSKNTYYIITFSLCQNEWTSGTDYYIKTQKIDDYKTLITDKQYDQKRLSISLPSIGNAISDLYDVLYGFNGFQEERPYTRDQLFGWENISPYNNLESDDKISMGWAMEEFKNYISELRFLAHGQGWRLIGYTTEEKKDEYSRTQIEDAQQCVIENQNDFWLTSQDILDLRPYNIANGYVIPVYAYDGEDGYNSYGLQSDWTLDNTDAFGYIYHKPRILWSNPDYISQDDELEENKGIETGKEDTKSYALHSIEYIFDHCMDEIDNSEIEVGETKEETLIKKLFGPSREPLDRF